MTHRLKTLAPYWDAVQRGDKTFEVRRDDRGFEKGDTLELVRYANGQVTPTTAPLDLVDEESCTMLTRRVTWILTGGQFGIEPGYVVMGLAEVLND